MKIVSENESIEIVNGVAKKYSDKCKIPVWNYWIKIKPTICFIFSIVSFLLSTETLKYYKDDLISLLEKSNANILWRATVCVIFFFSIIIVMFVMMIIHELIHLLSYAIFKNKCLVVVSKSLTISIMSINWRNKFQELFGIMAPFLIMQIFVCTLYYVINNIFIFLWLTLINLALSCSDLLAFIIILFVVPNNVKIFGHYYRRQQ